MEKRRTSCAVFGMLFMLVFTGLSCAKSATPTKGENKMSEDMQLYSWVRGGASICLAHISQKHTRAGKPGQEIVAFQAQIDEILWGVKQEAVRHYEVSLPISEEARLKFPDPVWGRVAILEGAKIFLVTNIASDESPDSLYVEEVRNPQDPVLESVRTVLREEKATLAIPQRVRLYLVWLAEGAPVLKLFGGEALAKDALPDGGRNGQVPATFAKSYLSERNQFVKLSLGTWMWEDIYPQFNASGQVAIINAAIQCLTDSSEDIRILTLDHLVELNPAELQRPGVVSSPNVVRLLKERLNEETNEQVRARVQRVIEALNH